MLKIPQLSAHHSISEEPLGSDQYLHPKSLCVYDQRLGFTNMNPCLDLVQSSPQTFVHSRPAFRSTKLTTLPSTLRHFEPTQKPGSQTTSDARDQQRCVSLNYQLRSTTMLSLTFTGHQSPKCTSTNHYFREMRTCSISRRVLFEVDSTRPEKLTADHSDPHGGQKRPITPLASFEVATIQ
jgi:hypothetical protein